MEFIFKHENKAQTDEFIVAAPNLHYEFLKNHEGYNRFRQFSQQIDI